MVREQKYTEENDQTTQKWIGKRG